MSKQRRVAASKFHGASRESFSSQRIDRVGTEARSNVKDPEGRGETVALSSLQFLLTYYRDA